MRKRLRHAFVVCLLPATFCAHADPHETYDAYVKEFEAIIATDEFVKSREDIETALNAAFDRLPGTPAEKLLAVPYYFVYVGRQPQLSDYEQYGPRYATGRIASFVFMSKLEPADFEQFWRLVLPRFATEEHVICRELERIVGLSISGKAGAGRELFLKFLSVQPIETWQWYAIGWSERSPARMLEWVIEAYGRAETDASQLEKCKTAFEYAEDNLSGIRQDDMEYERVVAFVNEMAGRAEWYYRAFALGCMKASIPLRTEFALGKLSRDELEAIRASTQRIRDDEIAVN